VSEEGRNRLIFYKLLELFSSSRCVRREELEEAVEVIDDAGPGAFYEGLSGEVCVRSLVPVAMCAIKGGCDPRRVSEYLSWRDFEEFVSEILLARGYEVVRGFRFGPRRMEIDVLAVDTVSSVALAVDCKHWSSRYSGSRRIREAALKHMQRLLELLKWCAYEAGRNPLLRRFKYSIAVVVTLGESVRGVSEGVAIVPVYYFRDFIDRLDVYVEEVGISKIANPCYYS